MGEYSYFLKLLLESLFRMKIVALDTFMEFRNNRNMK